jgi:hypothetical protein
MSENNDALVSTLIVAQQRINSDTAKALGEMATTLKDMNERLFITNGGVLKTIYDNCNTKNEDTCDKVTDVAKRTSKLEQRSRDTRKWLAGAIAVITTEGVTLGFLFQHFAGKVASVLDALKAVK